MLKMVSLWKIRLPVLFKIISRPMVPFLGQKAYFWALPMSAKIQFSDIIVAIYKIEKILNLPGICVFWEKFDSSVYFALS